MFRRAGLRRELLQPGQLDDLREALRLASEPTPVARESSRTTAGCCDGRTETRRPNGTSPNCRPSRASSVTKSVKSKLRCCSPRLPRTRAKTRACPGQEAWPARQIAAPIPGNLAQPLTSAGRWDEALEIIDEILSLDQPPPPAPDPRPDRRRPRGGWNGEPYSASSWRHVSVYEWAG